MKKFVSFIVSVAVGVSAMCCAVTSFAVDNAENSVVVFGDGIAAGLVSGGEVEYKYGDIIADYLGYDVEYFVQEGWRTSDLKNEISSNSAAIEAASEAEVIVISIGGNNLIRHSCKYILDYAAQISSSTYPVLKDGYNADNIPDDPTIQDVSDMVDNSQLKEYFLVNQTEAYNFPNKLKQYLAGTSANPTGFVQTEIVPETKEIVDMLRSMNPDADIVVQTVFQPFELSQDYWNQKFTGTSSKENYGTIMNRLRSNMETAMQMYCTELQNIDGIKIADVYDQFKSVDSPSKTNQGYAYYFTDIQKGNVSLDLSEMEFRPNQKGHLAIAASVLEQIGELHNDDGLLSYVYENLVDKDEYPEYALSTYKKVAGNEETVTYSLGDVNGDGIITPMDAAIALNEYAAIATNGDASFSKEQYDAANVNKDEYLTPMDAALILSYYAYASTTIGDVMDIEQYIASSRT